VPQSDGFEVLYPSGDFEVVVTSSAIPSVGATIRRHGKAWTVIDKIHNGRVVLRVTRVPDSKSDESSRPR